ncbi:RNase H1/viroplasmin domain-containing protein, partial [uncultured Bacteroides sp.]|uniref:RNase H1/viroplasmin domain-containing protein n=1 Tax=uncultured Bacteroides sp. TaxID=162156 RepID=UPI00259504B2
MFSSFLYFLLNFHLFIFYPPYKETNERGKWFGFSFLPLSAVMKKRKYYVVWAGVNPGIYTSWTDCQLQTKG